MSSAPGYLDSRLEDRAARGVGLLRDYLRRTFPDESLFHRVWILEASTTMDVLSAEQRGEVVMQLLAVQREDGGWALANLGDFDRVDGTAQTQDSDGYATGLALHALTRAGLPDVGRQTAKGVAWLRSHQREDGSWPGRSVNKERDPTSFVGKLMSDAATAYAARAIVECAGR